MTASCEPLEGHRAGLPSAVYEIHADTATCKGFFKAAFHSSYWRVLQGPLGDRPQEPPPPPPGDRKLLPFSESGQYPSQTAHPEGWGRAVDTEPATFQKSRHSRDQRMANTEHRAATVASLLCLLEKCPYFFSTEKTVSLLITHH